MDLTGEAPPSIQSPNASASLFPATSGSEHSSRRLATPPAADRASRSFRMMLSRAASPPPAGLQVPARRRAWFTQSRFQALGFDARWLRSERQLASFRKHCALASAYSVPPVSATKKQLLRALLAGTRSQPHLMESVIASRFSHMRRPPATVSRSGSPGQPARVALDDSVSRPGGRSLAILQFPFSPLPIKPPWRLAEVEWQKRITGWYRRPEELLTSLRDGVRLGYSGSTSGFHIRQNHPSAFLPAAAAEIDAEVLSELQKGRMAGPFTADGIRELFPFFRTSPMAVVPKQGLEGGYRIIDDLTAGGEDAVNGGIPDEEAAVTYQAFDDALRCIRSFLDSGGSCWLGKIDWKSAFRQIAVHRDDWPLLGLSWRGHLFVRLVLPFGARSSPRQFMRFAAAFRGILLRSGIRHVVYYLDDFLLFGSSAQQCAEAMSTMERIAAELGVELHPTKRDGPSQMVVFLGIGIDTVARQIFLPADKKAKLERICSRLLAARGASFAELESLVGYLQFASRVIQPGRIMTGLFWEQMRTLRERRAPRRARFALPTAALDDLRWWADCCANWNGVSFLPTAAMTEPMLIQSDACTSLGAGAVLFDTATLRQDFPRPSAWFFWPWSEMKAVVGADYELGSSWSINELELAAVVIALETFGERLGGMSVVIHTDNTTTESALETGRASNPVLLRLLRGAHALAVRFDFRIRLATHIAGARNVRADAASRLFVQDSGELERLGLTPGRRVRPVVPAWLAEIVKSFPQQRRCSP